MIAGLRTREIVVAAAALGTGLAGALVTLGSRGADAQFLQEQRHPPNLRPADVEHTVASAPDPRTGQGRGVSAVCKSRGSGPLQNPWSCVVVFKSGRRARLAVRVHQDGTYEGRYTDVPGAGASGCCIDLPGAR
jgi:hypothetical protein